MRPVSLDEAGLRAVYAAAGELQCEVAEVGALHVSEADVRRAVRRGLQMQLGTGVQPEVPVPKTAGWSGRLGAFDVGVLADDVLAAAVEVKWCRRPDNIAEALWDVLKLLSHTLDGDQPLRAYLVYGAPASLWGTPGDRPVKLFESRDHAVVELLSDHAKYWNWLLTGNRTARPRELRSEFSTRLVGSAQILTADGADWELRCVRVVATDTRMLYFDSDGQISDAQPAFGPLAPESRYIDTLDDIQIDPALPASRSLHDELGGSGQATT